MPIDNKTWGNNIWYLFHTIAYKIKDSSYLDIKDDLIFIIKSICSNLPCPDCSKDATEKLNKVNFNLINSKEDFKLLLFNFHNSINKKLNKPLFELHNLDNKYKNANIYALYHNFIIIYSQNSKVPQLMSASFHRQHILPVIKQKIEKILHVMD